MADLPALKQLEAELEPACRPATVPEIASVVERLFAHYPRPDLPNSAAVSRLDDWYDDLDGLPLDVLMATARDYRRSEARFAPTPGQFLAKAKRYYEPRRGGLGMARLIIKALEEFPPANDATAPERAA